MDALFPGLGAGIDLHPASVHLPLVAWFLALCVLLFEKRRPDPGLRTAGRWLAHVATLGALVASGLGLLAASQLVHDGPDHEPVYQHRNLMLIATGLGALASGLLERHHRAPAPWSARASLVALGMVCVVAIIGADRGAYLTYVLGVGVAQPAEDTSVERAEPAAEPQAVGLPWRTSDDYEHELSAVDSVVASLGDRADGMPSSWMATQRAASAHVDRAKLTGELDGYLRALELMDHAFERAPPGGGPHIARASLAFSVHRLEEAERAVDTAASGAVPAFAPIAEIEGLRGDIALHRCQFEAAATHYAESERIEPNMTSAFRRAMLEWRQGRFDEADALVVLAVERLGSVPGRTHAFFHLQRGLLDLDRGRYADALAHYYQADTAFGGWWLVHEHIAEALAALGQTELALVAYRDVVERTHNPELMDALAELLRERGATEEADRLVEEAGAAFEQQLEVLPEAAYGHALDHFIATDDPRALELARQNYALRPNGEAHVTLAQVLAARGEVDEAAMLLRAALETGYRSASLHATAAVLFEATGASEDAEAQRVAATEIAADAMSDAPMIGAPRQPDPEVTPGAEAPRAAD